MNSGFCVHWSNFAQHQSSPLDILATTKLFASHCVLAYVTKSHFYWWDCSAEKLSAYVNKTSNIFNNMEEVEDSHTTKPPTVVMPFRYPTQPNSADGQTTSIGRENATRNLKLLQYGMGHFLLLSTQVAQDT